MIRSGGQLDLLAWTPPETAVAYDPQLIRANSYEGRLSRAISVTLESCGYSRAEVTERMEAISGHKISLNILNAYASPSRDTHNISAVRLHAFLGATRDRRMAQFMVDDYGWSVIDSRDLPMLELGALQKHKRELARQERALRGAVRGGRW